LHIICIKNGGITTNYLPNLYDGKSSLIAFLLFTDQLEAISKGRQKKLFLMLKKDFKQSILFKTGYATKKKQKVFKMYRNYLFEILME
jgi:hypothetical protein